MSSLTDRIPEFEAATGRFARQRPDRVEPTLASSASPETAAQARDDEMRELVEKFEELYSELAPPPLKSGDDAIEPDDIRLDLPEGLMASSPVRKAAKPSTEPDDEPRRTPAPESPPADAVRPRSRSSQEPEVSFEDAMALLRAAEAGGKSAAERTSLDEEDESGPSLETAPPVAPVRVAAPRERTPRGEQTPAAPAQSWTSRSQPPWPRVLAVAVFALTVGTGLGYVAGKTPKSGRTDAKIETSPQGGAQLRFDYDLRKR